MSSKTFNTSGITGKYLIDLMIFFFLNLTLIFDLVLVLCPHVCHQPKHTSKMYLHTKYELCNLYTVEIRGKCLDLR